ncbi:MAG TPA: general stress protein [Microcella sp.]|nr:general stress protein [Microcella sp.]
MSQTPSLFRRGGAATQKVPRGDVLGSHETYADAMAVVDRLSKAEFDVKRLAIVGHDLTLVENVTGKLSYGRVAFGGAATGAWFGLFVGLLLVLFSPEPQFEFLAAAALIGAGFGLVLSVVQYALQRRRRDFTSTSRVLASRYDIIVEPGYLTRAQQLLGGESSPARSEGPPAADDAPPKR